MPAELTTADADDKNVLRVLRRLNEKGAVLVSWGDMRTAIVVRGDAKTCSTERKTVETLFARGMIRLTNGAGAAIEKYALTDHGKKTLDSMLESKRKKGSVGAYWLWQKGFLSDELLALAEKLADDAEAGRPSFDETMNAIGGDMGMVLRMLLKDRLGLETIEKRMGYSARSAKVVIKIALQQVGRL